VSNDKEGYVNNQVRLYYFDYNITRLSDGKTGMERLGRLPAQGGGETGRLKCESRFYRF
jgi:hypothetical protein